MINVLFPRNTVFYRYFNSVQLLCHVWLFVNPWTATHQASVSITNSKSLLKLMSISQWCHSTISSSVAPFSSFSSISVFSNESVLCIRRPKDWNFSFSISPSNEYSGLISFRMDWLDLLDVQKILKNLLQHHSSKALILWHSVFFIVQLSHPYTTTGKTIVWPDRPLLSKCCLCFLICCLGWS